MMCRRPGCPATSGRTQAIIPGLDRVRRHCSSCEVLEVGPAIGRRIITVPESDRDSFEIAAYTSRGQSRDRWNSLAEAPASPLIAPVRQRPALAWVANTNSSSVCPTHWYVLGMVRTLDLTDWAGRWVALDEHDRVVRDAETLEDLMSIIDTDGLEGVSIMRAPVPGEPVVYGLG